MLKVYERELVGPVPKFPKEIESHIDGYLEARAAGVAGVAASTPAPAEPATASGRTN